MVGEAQVNVSRLELLQEVSAVNSSTETSGSISILPESTTWLKQLSQSFERYRWNSVQIFWRGATGTTFGGLMAMGVDWYGRKKLTAITTIKRSNVTGLTPVVDVPLYTDSQGKPLVLPKGLLQSRQWYGLGAEASEDLDKGPGNLVYAAKHDQTTGAKFLGEIWIRYNVTLQGSCMSS